MGGQNSKVSSSEEEEEKWALLGGPTSYAAMRQLIAYGRTHLDDSLVKSASTTIDGFAAAGGDRDKNSITLGCLEKLIKDAVAVTLDAEKSINEIKEKDEKIWGNDEFYDLVKLFHDNSDSTLVFFRELEDRLRTARENQHKLKIAVETFDNGIKDGNIPDVTVLSSTLDGLRSFLYADNPFDQNFIISINEIKERHEKMSKTLKEQLKVVEKKLKKSKAMRRALCSMYAIVSVSLFVLVIVGVCVAPIPAIVVTVGGVMAFETAIAGVSTYDVSKEKEKAPKKQRDVLKSMHRVTDTSVAELKNINFLIDSLISKLRHMLNSGKLALDRGDDGIAKEMGELDKMAKEFSKTIDFLCEQVDKCRENIINARTSLLKKPSGKQ